MSEERYPRALPESHALVAYPSPPTARLVIEGELEDPDERLGGSDEDDHLRAESAGARRVEAEESFENLLSHSEHAESTRRAYLADWRDFCAWCEREQREDREADPLPCTEATLFRYLTARAPSLKISTLRRRQSSIRLAHRLARLRILASPEEPAETREQASSGAAGPLVARQKSIEALYEQAQRYSSHSTAASTIKAYELDWRDFERFCRERSLPALPSTPHYIALYLTDRANQLKVATLQRRLTSIRQMHKLSGYSLDTKHPAISKVWGGIRRAHGVSQVRKAALRVEELRLIALSLSDQISGLRDRALLLLGFAGAFRRAELTSLNVEDLHFIEGQGLIVTLRRSKTDQEGAGLRKAIPYGKQEKTCPVLSLERWLEGSGLKGKSGPLFRPFTRNLRLRPIRLSGHAVALILKRALRDALESQGWPQSQIQSRLKSLSGHSLRAGFVTSSAAEGVQEHVIMRQTGHKRVETLRRYIREEDLFQDNPFSALGL